MSEQRLAQNLIKSHVSGMVQLLRWSLHDSSGDAERDHLMEAKQKRDRSASSESSGDKEGLRMCSYSRGQRSHRLELGLSTDEETQELRVSFKVSKRHPDIGCKQVFPWKSREADY